jgi:hypothetical protein
MSVAKQRWAAWRCMLCGRTNTHQETIDGCQRQENGPVGSADSIGPFVTPAGVIRQPGWSHRTCPGRPPARDGQLHHLIVRYGVGYGVKYGCGETDRRVAEVAPSRRLRGALACGRRFCNPLCGEGRPWNRRPPQCKCNEGAMSVKWKAKRECAMLHRQSTRHLAIVSMRG